MSHILQKFESFLKFHSNHSQGTENDKKMISFTMKDVEEMNKIFEIHSVTTETLASNYISLLESFSFPFSFISYHDFILFNKVFIIVLEFSRYRIEFLRKLHLLSHVYSLNLSPSSESTTDASSARILTKFSIRNHSIWYNLPFWIDITKTIINEDIEKYEFIYKKLSSIFLSRSHTSPSASASSSTAAAASSLSSNSSFNSFFEKYFFSFSYKQILFLILITRIDSIITSMKSLCLSKEFLEKYQIMIFQKFHIKINLSSENEKEGESKNRGENVGSGGGSGRGLDGNNNLTPIIIEEFLSNLSLNYSNSFKTTVLFTLLKILQIPLLTATAASSSSSAAASAAILSVKNPFYFHSSIWNEFILKYSNSNVSSLSSCYLLNQNIHFYDIGYSPILSLLFIPALITILKNDEIYLSKVTYLSEKNNYQNYSTFTPTCFCGHSCKYWKLIGRIDATAPILPSLSFLSINSPSTNTNTTATGMLPLSSPFSPSSLNRLSASSLLSNIINKMKQLEKDYEKDAIIEEKHIQILENDSLFMNYIPYIVCEYCYRSLFLSLTSSSTGSDGGGVGYSADPSTPSASAGRKHHNNEDSYQSYDVIPIGSATIAYPVDADFPQNVFIMTESMKNILIGNNQNQKKKDRNHEKIDEFYSFILDFFGKKELLSLTVPAATPDPSPATVVRMMKKDEYPLAESKKDQDERKVERKEPDVKQIEAKGEYKETTSQPMKKDTIRTIESKSSSESIHSSSQAATNIIRKKHFSTDNRSNTKEDEECTPRQFIDEHAIKEGLSHPSPAPSTNGGGDTPLSTSSSAPVSMKFQPVSSTPTGILSPSSSFYFQNNEFHNFLIQLWNGITVTLIYSNHPLVAKTRIIFLRSNSLINNDLFRKKINSNSSMILTHSEILSWLKGKSIPLYLGWAHLRDRDNLTYDIKKSISLSDIKGMKIGSKQYKNCLKIITELQIVMMKIENDNYFEFVMKGLTELFSNVSSSYSK
jgi:hypothetical protein